MSDLSKLLIVKSAFRLKRAVFEASKPPPSPSRHPHQAATLTPTLSRIHNPIPCSIVLQAFKNAQAAQSSAPAAKLNVSARLERQPPTAELRSQLSLLGDDDELRSALLFAASVAWFGSDWTGEVLFQVSDG